MTIVMNTLEDFRQLSQVCSGKVCLNIPSSSIAVSFTVNFIMGCGFLGVPWGFNEAGIGTGILTLFLATGVCLITAFLLLETMARAEATTRTEYLDRQSLPTTIQLSWRKFEVVELVDMFIGKIPRTIYLVFVSLYLYGTEWGYAAVFGNSFASHVKPAFLEDDNTRYLFFVAIFAVIVIPLSLCDLREQVAMQITMTGMRALIIVIMVGSTAIALATGEKEFGEWSPDKASMSVSEFFLGTGGISFPHFAQLFPIVVYSQLFHAGIPVLSQPIKDKTKVQRVFGYTYVITVTVYALASGMLAYYFRDNVQDSCNVNWSKYTGSGLRTFLSYVVVLFPAFDVLSVTPMNTIALASNIMSAYYGNRIAKAERNRKLVAVFRMIALLPPLVGACFVSKLTKVLDYTGIVGLVIAFIMPCLLWIFSRRHMSDEFKIPVENLPHTIYAGWWSNIKFVYALLAGGISITIFVTLGLLGAYDG